MMVVFADAPGYNVRRDREHHLINVVILGQSSTAPERKQDANVRIDGVVFRSGGGDGNDQSSLGTVDGAVEGRVLGHVRDANAAAVHQDRSR